VKFWAIALLAIAACSIPATASSTSRAHGAQVFAATGCQHCHMIGGIGGHRGPDLSGVGRRCSKAQMRRQIVNGSNIMPSFGEELQPSELKDLIDYLHSCRKKNVESNIRSDPQRAEITK
jgi:mono/diheme cytochrome c family protein